MYRYNYENGLLRGHFQEKKQKSSLPYLQALTEHSVPATSPLLLHSESPLSPLLQTGQTGQTIQKQLQAQWTVWFPARGNSALRAMSRGGYCHLVRHRFRMLLHILQCPRPPPTTSLSSTKCPEAPLLRNLCTVARIQAVR